jgi:predicted permease
MQSSPTAMISHSMWQQMFGGASDVIGRTLRVNDFPVTIVGVAPPRFVGTDGSSGPTIWMPLAANPLIQHRSSAAFLSSDSTFLNAIARLGEDVSARAASSVVDGIARRATRPSSNAALPAGQTRTSTADVVVMRVTNARADDGSKLVLTSAAALGFSLLVLLITCTNVSAIMVGLAVGRRREIGVRLSLGAPRGRLIRQLLTESVLLALIAAAIGLAVTAAGVRIASASLDDVQLVVDWRVTIATCAIAIATGILLGVSPALHATRLSVSDVLKSTSSSVAATRSRLQRALVVLQITLTQPLLVGLGVVMVTMLTDMGTGTRASEPSQIAEIELDTWSNHASTAERAARIAAIVDRVGAMPGVAAALPMQMGTITASVTVHPADRIGGISYETEVDARMISAPKGYFAAFNVPIVRGRDFDARELIRRSDDASRPVSFESVIIGDGLARRYWGNANPIGRRLQMAGAKNANEAPMVIVGVIDDAAAGPSEANGQIRVYVPYAPMNTGVIARTVGPAKAFLEPMRKVVIDEAPQMPVYRVQTMEQREADFRRDVLRGGGVAAGGGLLALLLSAIGLYAVVSFSVSQRTREIGIRTALGAQSSTVVRMFFTKGLTLSAVGLLLGLPLSMVATRIIAQTLNWPMSSSPVIGVVIGAVVVAVASLAAWIPARRASTIDPIIALRTD